MLALFATIWHYLQLCAPMFLIVGLGYGLTRWLKWPDAINEWLSRFVFNVALPALLFLLMSDLSRLPPVDWRVLIAFFGSCLVVFVLARLLARKFFRLDGVSQSLFALAAIFSNNALLGLPLAKITLGPAAIPTVALVLVFNSLTLYAGHRVGGMGASWQPFAGGVPGHAQERADQPLDHRHPQRHGCRADGQD